MPEKQNNRRQRLLKVRSALAKKYPYPIDFNRRTMQQQIKNIKSQRTICWVELRRAAAESAEPEKRLLAQRLGTMLARKVSSQHFSSDGLFQQESVVFAPEEIGLAQKIGTEDLQKMADFIERDYTKMQLVWATKNGALSNEEHTHLHGSAQACGMLKKLGRLLAKQKK